MQYPKTFFATLFLAVLVVPALAQQPAKTKKPVKNPPQYPHIIDLEGQQAPPQTGQAKTQEPAAAPAQQPDALVQAVMLLVGEVRSLSGELRALNLRQQAQLEMTRLTRLDLRVDHYERELKTVRERLATLEYDEQNLNQLMSRDGLMAQTANIGTLDRETTMRQIKQQHEYRLRQVLAEKERLQQQAAGLDKELTAIRTAGSEAEQRIKQAEEQLKGNPPER